MGDGFEVMESVELGDLTGVKEDKVVLPVSSGVKLRVQKVSSRLNQKSGITSLNVQVQLPDGVEVPEKDAAGSFTGAMTKKFVNKVDFIELPYKVDTTIRTEERWTKPSRPYLVPLKQFLAATGYDLKAPPAINDELMASLVGREVRANIKQREIRMKQADGSYKGTGEFKHEFGAFSAA